MTPEEKTDTQVEHSTVKADTISSKDMLIPAAIAIAGAFIGIGLYFSGGPGGGGGLNVPTNAPTADNSGEETLQSLVEKSGVSPEDVEQCVNDGEVAQLVQADADNAIATGGRGTPWSIVIGPNGKTYPVNGALPAAALQQTIDLARSGADAPNTGDSPATDQVNPVTEDDHIKGDLNAPIKIIEYSDFDCPFCSRFHETMDQVVSQNDDVAWVYRHFPLDQLHPNARTVAQISECVANLGGNEAFWTFTDGYFAR